ncbi:MAG: PIG-L family deacetylase [Bacteroidota bacterium]
MINRQLLKKFRQLKEKAYKKYSGLHHVDFLEGPEVLVLAPHPDDDIFGCGGTLIRHLEEGHEVRVVYLCQGEKGIPHKTGNAAAEIRRQEAITATNIIGIPAVNLYFFNQPDEQLKVNQRLIKKLEELINSFLPKIIYLPSPVDQHHDHLQTNLLLKAVKCKNVLLAAYEVWTPHIPNRIVDITGAMPQKQKAMSAHQSQIEVLDYFSAITGLNQYRASLYPKVKMKYAEAFMVASKEEYFRL